MTIHKLVEGVINDALANQPRSLQTSIGPSQVGDPCEHCLNARLAGWEEARDAAWLPFLGTATHAALEEIFAGNPDYLSEARVDVGWGVSGTCDLFHIPSGTVVDFKLVGQTTLTAAKRGPSDTYRVQVHCYALGMLRAGHDVNDVAIYYLPRNAVSLRSGVFWTEPFQPLIAVEALERMERIKQILAAMPSIEARDAYITSLPRAKGCWSCPRYPDYVKPKRASTTSSLEELLAG